MTVALMTPEWRLAAEVLRQAAEDSRCVPGQAQLTLWDIDEAKRFVGDLRGAWAEARTCWCDAAGVHPVAYREHAARTAAL